MKCFKCLQRCGQMMCCECYTTIKVLNEQKKKVIVQKKNQLQDQLSELKQLSQSFERKIQVQRKKAVLLAKIKEYHSRIKIKKQNIAKLNSNYQQLTKQFTKIESNVKQIHSNKQKIGNQIQLAKQKVTHAKKKKQQLKQQIINIINNKFRQINKYTTYDEVQFLEESHWNHYVLEEGLQNLQTSVKKPQQKQLALMSTQTTNIISILGDFDKNKQKILKYFERSIKIIRMLSHIYGIQLPYRIKSAEFKSRLSLKRSIFDQSCNNKFNYTLLRRHQANTVYLYSRACMTVFYPNIEQGRLQDLHETMIHRLKGYSMRPMSTQFRKIPLMNQLSAENIVQHFYTNQSNPIEQQIETQENYIEDQQLEDIIELLI